MNQTILGSITSTHDWNGHQATPARPSGRLGTIRNQALRRGRVRGDLALEAGGQGVPPRGRPGLHASSITRPCLIRPAWGRIVFHGKEGRVGVAPSLSQQMSTEQAVGEFLTEPCMHAPPAALLNSSSDRSMCPSGEAGRVMCTQSSAFSTTFTSMPSGRPVRGPSRPPWGQP